MSIDVQLDTSASPTLANLLEGATNPAGVTIAQLVVDGSITDVGGNPVEAIALEAVDTSLGTWQYSLNAGGSWLTIQAEQLNSQTNTLSLLLGPTNMIRLLPFGDLNGSLAEAITFRAWDMGSGAAGDYVVTTPGTGGFSAQSDTASLTVEAVNDAPTFSHPSDGGKLIQPVIGVGDYNHSTLLQPDGKLILTGQSAINGDIDFSFMRVNADGSVDATFGTNGQTVVSIGSSQDVGWRAALADDGGIVLAGRSITGSGWSFSAVRLDANGNLDDSFGGTGKVIAPLASPGMAGTDVAIQPDGKIVLLGSAGSPEDYGFVRLNVDGSIDQTFGTDGVAVFPLSGSPDVSWDVAIQADGKILATGYTFLNGDEDYGIMRLTADGALDLSFGANGKVVLPVGFGNDEGIDLVIQPDGKIVIGGHSDGAGGKDYSVVRLNANGTLDEDFGNQGMLVIPVGNGLDLSSTVALQPDGKLLLAGQSQAQNFDFSVVRLEANGDLDTSFGVNGKAIIPVALGDESATTVLVLQDGDIILGGTVPVGSSFQFGVVRLNSNGSLDTAFNGQSINTLGGTASFTEDGPAVALDESVAVFDADLAALAGGAGNYDGASVQLQRSNANSPDDVFSGRGDLSFDNGQAILSGTVIGSVTSDQGQLQIVFNANATQARVNEALSSIAYANTSDSPPASVEIAWTFTDGNVGAQGTGGPSSASGITTVNIAATNDNPIITINPGDSAEGFVVEPLEPPPLPSLAGLVGWWTGDGYVEDASFTGNDGSFAGAYVDGARGDAFDLGTGTVFIPDNPAYNLGGEFTMAFWFQTGPSDSGSLFMGQDEGPGEVNKWFIDYGYFGQAFDFHVNGPWREFLLSDQVPPPNDGWRHMAFKVENQTYTFNLDGQEVGSGAFPYPLPDPSAPLLFGEAETLLTNDGKIDEVMIFNRALSAEEIGLLATDDEVTTTGTLSFSDGDITDIHTLRPILASLNAIGTLRAEIVTDSSGSGTGGLINWTYSASASQLDSLKAGQSVEEFFTITVEDGFGGTAQQQVTITLTGTNDVPTVASQISDQAATEDATFSFQLPAGIFADVDAGDTLAYSATMANGSALPSWLSFNAQTQTFSGTPLNGDVGSLNVRVAATDSGNLSAFDDFAITVANTNDAPTGVVTITGNTTQGQTLTASNTLADDDGLGPIGYQWLANAQVILGATGSTLLLSANEVNKAISVQASYTDARGTSESVSSASTQSIGAIVVGVSTPNTTVSGTAGNDVMSTSANSGTLSGGLGDDSYNVNRSSVIVSEAANAGYDQVFASINYLLTANVEKLTLTGSAAIDGSGNGLANVLVGNSANNKLTGGLGADTLTGGTGADRFIFTSIADSPAQAYDTITDFNRLQGDRISLTGFDANPNKGGPQSFSFIGTAAFTPGNAGAGQLRFDAPSNLLYGNTDADLDAEFAIQLTGVQQVLASDLIL